MRAIILALLVISSGYMINDAFAQISTNQEFHLKGSGFAITDNEIKDLMIDLKLTSQDKQGSSINFVTQDGSVTLNDAKFHISQLEGEFLREGNFVRLNGEIQSPPDSTISFFGRLVDENKHAAVYSFTGKITTSDNAYKVIYTTKLGTPQTIETTDSIVRILKGASSQGVATDYKGAVDPQQLRYFSDDRISVEPGTTITITNNDDVAHTIISGTENNDRNKPFTPDGKINTGIIAPQSSATITFDDAGFYRLYDPNYPWMRIVAYVFPTSDNVILGQGQPRN